MRLVKFDQYLDAIQNAFAVDVSFTTGDAANVLYWPRVWLPTWVLEMSMRLRLSNICWRYKATVREQPQLYRGGKGRRYHFLPVVDC